LRLCNRRRTSYDRPRSQPQQRSKVSGVPAKPVSAECGFILFELRFLWRGSIQLECNSTKPD
jgi:hypothetical protein